MTTLKNVIGLRMLTEEISALQRNGFDFICPFVPPIPMRTQGSALMGGQPQMSIQKTNCNSGCSLFKINEADIKSEKISVTLCCGGTPVSYEIENVIPVPTVNDNKGGSTDSGEPKIISMNNPN